MNIDEMIEVDADDLFISNPGDSNQPPKKEDKIETKQVDISEAIVDEDLFDTDDIPVQAEDIDDEIKKVKNKPVIPNLDPTETKEGDDNEDGNKDPSKDSKLNENEFNVFASSLAEKGFFPDSTDEDLAKIEDEDDLSEALSTQLRHTFGEWKDNFRQNMIQNLVAEGYVKQEDVKNIGMKVYSDTEIKGDINIAKDIIRSSYAEVNLPNEDIKTIIDNLEDVEGRAIALNKNNAQKKITRDAKIAEDYKQKEALQEQQRLEFNNKLKDNVFEQTEFIPGRKLKTKDKESIFRNINPTMTKINNNLKHYLPIISALNHYGFLDKKFEKLIKEGESRGVSKMQKVLESKKRNTGTSATNTRTKSNILIDDSNTPNIYR